MKGVVILTVEEPPGVEGIGKLVLPIASVLPTEEDAPSVVESVLKGKGVKGVVVCSRVANGVWGVAEVEGRLNLVKSVDLGASVMGKVKVFDLGKVKVDDLGITEVGSVLGISVLVCSSVVESVAIGVVPV